tara:strand:+ start:1662 stop:2657 length:996 start_codon:yes stop_codon:yes gene_type:complete
MGYATQAEVDEAFAVLDEYLAEREAEPVRGCLGCGSTVFHRGANPGANCGYYDVCADCGAVAQAGYGRSDSWASGPTRPVSNYKRIHHWHERISQLLLQESDIPPEHFIQIAQRLLDGSHAVINKDVIRGVLRSLNMQQYIEKWLKIIQRCTGIEPPKPGAQLLQMLDDAFIELQQPFKHFKVGARKNFLNYNYVFCRLFQRLGCTQFCMFFPLIKSRQKLKVLDEMWAAMVTSVGWDVKPLQHVAPFAVRLEQPAALLRQITDRVSAEKLAVLTKGPSKTGFRKSDQRLLRELDRQTQLKRPRSSQPEPELQRLGQRVVRPRSVVAKLLR